MLDAAVLWAEWTVTLVLAKLLCLSVFTNATDWTCSSSNPAVVSVVHTVWLCWVEAVCVELLFKTGLNREAQVSSPCSFLLLNAVSTSLLLSSPLWFYTRKPTNDYVHTWSIIFFLSDSFPSYQPNSLTQWGTSWFQTWHFTCLSWLGEHMCRWVWTKQIPTVLLLPGSSYGTLSISNELDPSLSLWKGFVCCLT